MKRKFLTRAGATLLSVLFAFSCVLSRPAALNARAASLALDGAALDEMSMVLWNLLMNAMVACGVSSAVPDGDAASGTIKTFGDYDFEAALYEALVDYYHVVSVSDDSMVFTLQNGRTVTFGELLELTGWDTVGTGARRIPSEETWQRFRVVQGGGSGSQPPSPDDESMFKALVGVSVSSAAFFGIANFVKALQSGEVEGLDPADYFPDGFDGTLDQDAEGNYIINAARLTGTGYQTYNGQPVSYKIISDLQGCSNSYPVVAYFSMNSVRTDCPEVGSIYFMGRRTTNEIIYFNIPASVTSYYLTGTRTLNQNSISYYADPNSYSLNIPVFSSRAAAELFLKTGEFTDCENALDYDYAALSDALPDNFAPLTGTELDPSVFNALFPALLSAIQSAFPQPQPNPDPDAEPEPVPLPDPVAGTAAFNKVVADTAADVAAGAAPNPDPEPNPNPDIEIGSYKTDLTMIFPFCLPFDLIRLLNALDAEPVTPVFEIPFVVPALDIDITVRLDMSFLEPAMEVFRMCEVVSFILGLILVTHKVIKW